MQRDFLRNFSRDCCDASVRRRAAALKLAIHLAEKGPGAGDDGGRSCQKALPPTSSPPTPPSPASTSRPTSTPDRVEIPVVPARAQPKWAATALASATRSSLFLSPEMALIRKLTSASCTPMVS